MSQNPSTNLRLYGTEEPVAATRTLRAGPLSAEFEAGGLRYIRYHGHELIRAITYIVRDPAWGTYNPAISDLSVQEEDDAVTLSYRGHVEGESASLDYSARLNIEATGRIEFDVSATPSGDFSTNRTGFVILHPLAGVAGAGVTVETADGETWEGRFPEIIDPLQPMMNLRALNTTPVEGLNMRLLMEGDVFEMEDQRNWTDASFKTYVRPLALPWPYLLADGETFQQRITLVCDGDAAPTVETSVVELGIADAAKGGAPAFGQALPPEVAIDIPAGAEPLRALGLGHLMVRHDPLQGHTPETLVETCRNCAVLGVPLWLELVVASVDLYHEELAALGSYCAEQGLGFGTVAVTPAADLVGTLPGSPWPPAPPAAALLDATREAFPDARVVGGMQTFFTELNRKHPPLDAVDAVGFTTSALVHAGDDRSLMETLEVLPAIMASARAIADGKPVLVGPSNIGMRLNPYGDAPKDNTANIRQAMNRNDPRQRGLCGAAWAVGYYARMAYGGAAAVTMGAPFGAFGCMFADGPDPQLWFDSEGGLFPVFHAHRALAALAGRPLLDVENSAPDKVQVVAVQEGDGVTVVLANITPDPVTVTLPRTPTAAAVLDSDGFVEASRASDYFSPEPYTDRDFHLGAYAIAQVNFA